MRVGWSNGIGHVINQWDCLLMMSFSESFSVGLGMSFRMPHSSDMETSFLFFFFFHQDLASVCGCSVIQSYLTLCDPMDGNPPGSSVHGISQARILEGVAISFSKGSSQPRDRTRISCISCTDRQIFYHWATGEAHLASATAKSLQSYLTLCDPIDGSPPGSPVPGILQARTPEWVAIAFSNAWKWKVKVKSLSHVWLLATPWTAAHQAPPSMGFSRQEYWSGVPLPSPFSF